MVFEIAGLKVGMTPHFPRLIRQSQAYRSVGDPAFNVAPNANEQEELLKCKETQEAAEYTCCSADFCRKLPDYGRFFLHASAVVLDHRGYLFSAPSGTGKSTHTALWLQEFPGSFLLNDDKPVIWPQKNQITVWGTPFSGKSDKQVNMGVPLQAICFLKRGSENHISQLNEEEALAELLNNTCRPANIGQMNALLDMLEMVVSQIGIFRLECTPSPEAARLAQAAMSKSV